MENVRFRTLDHFWNGWATTRNDIILIVCGSATSWIIDKVINNYGGLHNRLSGQIYLRPFRLSECEEFSNTMKLGYRRKQIVEAYMVLGGIPYYWSYLRKGFSVAQNFDRMFFSARKTQTTKTIHTTIISTYGLTDGGHAFDIHSQVTMNDLFD